MKQGPSLTTITAWLLAFGSLGYAVYAWRSESPCAPGAFECSNVAGIAGGASAAVLAVCLPLVLFAGRSAGARALLVTVGAVGILALGFLLYLQPGQVLLFPALGLAGLASSIGARHGASPARVLSEAALLAAGTVTITFGLYATAGEPEFRAPALAALLVASAAGFASWRSSRHAARPR